MINGVVKSPPSCVAMAAQDFDITIYPFTLEQPLRLGERNSYLAISSFFARPL